MLRAICFVMLVGIFFIIYFSWRQDIKEYFQTPQTLDESIENLVESDYIDKVLNSKIPVLLWVCDDYSTICANNKKVLGQVAKTYQNKIKVMKLDENTNRVLVDKLQTKYNSYIITYSAAGAEKERLVGSVSYNAVSKIVDNVLAEPKDITNLPNSLPTSTNQEEVSIEIEDLVESDYGDKVLSSKIPVLLWVCADYYGACEQNAIVVKNIATKYSSKIKVMRADWRINENLADRLNAYGSPTIIFYKNGKEIKRLIGAVSYEALIKMADAELINKVSNKLENATTTQKLTPKSESPTGENTKEAYSLAVPASVEISMMPNSDTKIQDIVIKNNGQHNIIDIEIAPIGYIIENNFSKVVRRNAASGGFKISPLLKPQEKITISSNKFAFIAEETKGAQKQTHALVLVLTFYREADKKRYLDIEPFLTANIDNINVLFALKAGKGSAFSGDPTVVVPLIKQIIEQEEFFFK